MLRLLLAALLTLFPSTYGLLQAEEGIFPDKILIGQSAAFSGPAERLGLSMRTGMEAYFRRVNESGGIYGRRLELRSLDDGYEPERCRQTTRQLIEEDKVFLLLGYVGTPTSQIAMPMAINAGIPFVAPFTGAEFLRSPSNPQVFNLRASYMQEAEALTDYLVRVKQLQKIVCLYQDDSFGNSGLSGFRTALQKRELKLHGAVSFERNTIDLANGLEYLVKEKPDAVAFVGPYRPCALLVKAMHAHPELRKATLATVSFVGTSGLLAETKATSNHIVVSQVVPSPWDNSLPVVKNYLEDMDRIEAGDQVDYVSFEGYLAAKFTCQVLERCGTELTREVFIQAVDRQARFDLDGFVLEFSSTDRQGSDRIFLTQIHAGRVDPIRNE